VIMALASTFMRLSNSAPVPVGFSSV